jgi:hypothetical protein
MPIPCPEGGGLARRSRSVRLRLASVLALLLTACVAALVAHLAIDALGDVALTRDAYDDVSHGSRAAVLVAVLACGLAAVFRLVFVALDANGERSTRLARGLARIVPRSPAWFIVCSVVGAAAMLVGMEMFDAFVATGRVVDIPDALGGSPWFGLGLEVPIAVAVAWLTWRALRWLAESSGAIARAIEILLAERKRSRHARFARYRWSRSGASRELALLTRRAGKRGPPLPA